jgi:hypothetical protein
MPPHLVKWTSDDLDKIGNAEELEITLLQSDGKLHKPVTIWVVRVGADLFVRSYRGGVGAWFRRAQVRHEGHIQAGDVNTDVIFVVAMNPAINDQIDAAYQTKYHHYEQYVKPMITPEARSTTLKLIPRATSF